jgi:hypothetical protein
MTLSVGNTFVRTDHAAASGSEIVRYKVVEADMDSDVPDWVHYEVVEVISSTIQPGTAIRGMLPEPTRPGQRGKIEPGFLEILIGAGDIIPD